MNNNSINSFATMCCFILVTFLLVGCQSDNSKYCPGVEPVVESGDYFFNGVVQPIDFVSGSENPLAISCHNCYQNNSEEISDTTLLIESAILNGVDLIELDIVMSDEEGMNPYVSHESESVGPLLRDVIASPALINASQILFIEIKGQLDKKENVRAFFRSLMEHVIGNSGYAYFNEQRFTVVRSIETDKTLRRFREVLTEDEFEPISSYVKLSRLFYPKQESKMYAEIDQAHSCGFHMIELDTRLELPSIKTLNSYAENKGLSVNVFTVDESNYMNVMAELKDDVDVLTVESRFSDETLLLETSLFQKIKEFY